MLMLMLSQAPSGAVQLEPGNLIGQLKKPLSEETAVTTVHELMSGGAECVGEKENLRQAAGK